MSRVRKWLITFSSSSYMPVGLNAVLCAAVSLIDSTILGVLLYDQTCIPDYVACYHDDDPVIVACYQKQPPLEFHLEADF